MHKIALSIVLILFTSAVSPQALRSVKNNAFTRGEKLSYKVYYNSLLTGDVAAGKANLEIKDDNTKILKRNTLHIVGIGKTLGVFNLFFKVTDRYETIIDEETVAPWVFIRRVNEGGYIINQDVTFDQYKHLAKSNTKTVKVPPYVQDLLSFFYYARTLDMKDVKVGDGFPLQFFLDDTVYSINIQYQGREIKTVRSGTYHCLKFKPMVLTGEVFKDPYPMTLWISDDQNRIPVLLESEILVGSVKLELVKCSGLKNPATSLIPDP